MNSAINLSKTELREKINLQELQSLQLINIAMAAGVILLAAVILFLKNSTAFANSGAGGSLNFPLLKITFIVVALIFYALVYVLPQILFTPARLEQRLAKPFYDAQKNELFETTAKLVQLYKMQMIVRLTLLESVSMLGLLLLFVSTMNGATDNHPGMWLLLAPTVIQIVYTYKNLPTKESVSEFIDVHILRKILQL